jgi:hypothetical protein
VSDTRWIGSVPSTDSTTVWVRPRLVNTGTLWSPRRGLMAAVRGGQAAVTAEVLHRVFSWLERPGAALAEKHRTGADHDNRTEPR